MHVDRILDPPFCTGSDNVAFDSIGIRLTANIRALAFLRVELLDLTAGVSWTATRLWLRDVATPIAIIHGSK
jgi:hypothetical protein